MGPRSRRTLPLAVALLGLAFVAAGCSRMTGTSTAPSTGTDNTASATTIATPAPGGIGEAYVYHYFPDAEVYYAPDRDLYFWRGASYWGVGHDLPGSHQLSTSFHEISLDSDKPYRAHRTVTAYFPPAGTQEEEALSRMATVPIDSVR